MFPDMLRVTAGNREKNMRYDFDSVATTEDREERWDSTERTAKNFMGQYSETPFSQMDVISIATEGFGSDHNFRKALMQRVRRSKEA